MFRTNKEILAFLHELHGHRWITDGMPISWNSPHIQETLQSCLAECFKTDDPSEIIEILQEASDAVVFRTCHTVMKRKPEYILRVIAQQLHQRDPAEYLLWLITCLGRGSSASMGTNDVDNSNSSDEEDDNESLCSSSSPSSSSSSPSTIALTSAHGSKGCTFEGPVLLVDYARYGQNPNATDDSNLLYVAMTRGKGDLYMVTTRRCCNMVSRILRFHTP